MIFEANKKKKKTPRRKLRKLATKLKQQKLDNVKSLNNTAKSLETTLKSTYNQLFFCLHIDL